MLTTLLYVGLGIWLLPFAAVLAWTTADRVFDAIFPTIIDWPDDTNTAIDEAVELGNSGNDAIYQALCFERWEAEL